MIYWTYTKDDESYIFLRKKKKELDETLYGTKGNKIGVWYLKGNMRKHVTHLIEIYCFTFWKYLNIVIKAFLKLRVVWSLTSYQPFFNGNKKKGILYQKLTSLIWFPSRI